MLFWYYFWVSSLTGWSAFGVECFNCVRISAATKLQRQDLRYLFASIIAIVSTDLSLLATDDACVFLYTGIKPTVSCMVLAFHIHRHKVLMRSLAHRHTANPPSRSHLDHTSQLPVSLHSIDVTMLISRALSIQLHC